MIPGPFVSPATHGLRYDQVRFKASHNSYAKKASLEEQLAFDRRRPDRRGFRGLEIDVHQDVKGCTWCVRHLTGPCASVHGKKPARGKGDEPRPDCLGDWLGVLRAWSDRNPDHDVVTLTLDLKKVDRRDTFAQDFDALLVKSGFDRRRVFRPIEITGAWPTLGEMRGRFVLCLSGLEDVKTEYTRRPGASERLCFADIALGPGRQRPPGDPRLFMNFNWRDYEVGSGNRFTRPTGRPYVVRAYSLRDDVALGSWSGAERHGVNVMATDWLNRLSVGAEPFAAI